MIVQRHQSWWRMLFSIRGTSLQRTIPRLFFIVLFSTCMVLIAMQYPTEFHNKYSLTITPFQLIGLAISIFLGFRNNVAYDRFWEGRKLWGQLVNNSRSFARQVTTLILPEDGIVNEKTQALHDELIAMTIGYVNALRHHLRSTDPTDDIKPFISSADLDKIQGELNKPIFILRRMGEKLKEARLDGLIDRFHILKLEESLENFTNIQGGCERILGTPIPYAYTVLMHRIVAFYCLGLPFGLIDSTGAMTPIVVAFISYAFLGLDDIGEEIEDPFGFDPNDLPLGELCYKIEVNLLQHQDDTELPPTPTPIRNAMQ